MGRKSSAKENRPTGSSSPPPRPQKGFGFLFLSAVIVALVGVGLFAMWGRHNASTTAGTSASDAAKSESADASAVAENEAAVQALAALGPHKQANLPPIPFQGYAPPRPPEVVTAAYQFAAEHPEIALYVPCFCGCQNQGHRGNEDCFVRSRDANGDVTEWEEHGLECQVCIDVATRSRQMYASGASVRDIRAAVEKEFATGFSSMTPTPKPPPQSR